MTASPGTPPGPPPAAFAASTSNLASSSTPSASGAGVTIPGPPRIVNVYHVRTVATPKQCYVCHRETTTCLATDGVTDFLYTCKHHLLDPGVSLLTDWPVGERRRSLNRRLAVCPTCTRLWDGNTDECTCLAVTFAASAPVRDRQSQEGVRGEAET